MSASDPDETFVILAIRHRKPMPSKVALTDVISDRVYCYLYSQGVEADVRASLVPRKKEAWEQSNGQPA